MDECCFSSDREVVAPIVEPVSLVEAKTWLRVDADDLTQDGDITRLIKAMRRFAENYTRRAFCLRTRELALSYFPAFIEVPFPPLQSVVSITYTDVNGAAQVVAPSTYQVDTFSSPGRIAAVYGSFWPLVRFSDFNPVRVRYVCGYAPIGSPTPAVDDASGVPDTVKQWMHARIATLYENREQFIDIRGNAAQLPFALADGILDELVLDPFC